MSLSALPLIDLRGEIKQEELPASAPAEGNMHQPLFSYDVWRRDHTLDAALVYLLSCLCPPFLFARRLAAQRVLFRRLADCVYT